MFSWRIQVSNQWHVRKDHVPLCLTIQLAFDCDWHSSVQGANDPNAYTSQKLVCEATLHLARFKLIARYVSSFKAMTFNSGYGGILKRKPLIYIWRHTFSTWHETGDEHNPTTVELSCSCDNKIFAYRRCWIVTKNPRIAVENSAVTHARKASVHNHVRCVACIKQLNLAWLLRSCHNYNVSFYPLTVS